MTRRSAARPLVSVITTTFNAGSMLARCLESVAAQTLPGVEHIVVDGGSTDGTVEVLRAWDERLGGWVSERDRGIYDAMNKGVALARGERLFFLGADDVLAGPDVLSRCEPHLRSDASVVYGDIRYPDGHLFRSGAGRRLLLSNTIHHQGAFYAARVFDGWRFDTSLRIVADYDLNLRLYRRGERFVRTDVVVAECGDAGASNVRVGESFREMNRVRRRHVGWVANAALTVVLAAGFAHHLLLRRIQRASRR
jgi:glycosyltransferase involved in cell wall biosynthesis